MPDRTGGCINRCSPASDLMLRRVRMHDVDSLDELAAFLPTDLGDLVLVFDADNTLAPQGAPLDQFSVLVNSAIDRFEALEAVTRVIVLTNGPERGVPRMIPRGNKPWTTRRRLGLERNSRIIVIGDQILTDGVLAWRLGATFVHLVVDEDNEAPRQAAMRLVGKILTALFFRRSP